MDRPRVYKTEAVVLKGVPTGEADRVLTLYTPYLGKFNAVARGVRRPGSHLGGHTEPLVHTRLLLARGQSLDTITQAEALATFPSLREDLHRLSQALYAADLLIRATPEGEPSPPVFHLLLDLLRGLDRLQRRGPAETLLRWYELRLMALLGYLPELHRCVHCTSPLSPGEHLFAPLAGGAVCPRCAPRARPPLTPLSTTALKVLRFLAGARAGDVPRLQVPPEVMAQLKRLLGDYIRLTLEREVPSARFLEGLRRAGH